MVPCSEPNEEEVTKTKYITSVSFDVFIFRLLISFLTEVFLYPKDSDTDSYYEKSTTKMKTKPFKTKNNGQFQILLHILFSFSHEHMILLTDKAFSLSFIKIVLKVKYFVSFALYIIPSLENEIAVLYYGEQCGVIDS